MADQYENLPDRELSPELQAFEAQLASLVPSTGCLQRDRLIFEAGRAAAEAERRRPASALHWVRSAASILITAAATFVLASFVLQPAPVAVKGSSKSSSEKSQVPRNRTVDTPQPLTAPSVGEPGPASDVQAENSFRTLLAAFLFRADRANGETSASYFRQRDRLLAMGGDRLAEPKKTAFVQDTRQNTQVSYMDLLGELTSERHGLTPDESGSAPRKPSKQGTDL